MIPLANHLWQSTLFAFLAWVLTLTLKKNRAAARYWIWLAASVKFLIPLSLFVWLGSQIGWRAAPVVTHSAVPMVMEQIGQLFVAPAVPLAETPSAALPLAGILSAIWGCGFVGIAFTWWRKWRRVRAAVRAGSVVHLELNIPVVTSSGSLEPGVFGIWRPILLLPEGVLARLSPKQLEAVIAHELCHVRRRDNLAAAVHMMVEAMFWFHPLVWWIGTRLIEERERACDEEVLRLGSEPRVYAEGILRVCEYCVESPLACVTGVTGADLKRRIRAILSRRPAANLTFAHKLLLASAAIAAAAGPVLIGITNAPPVLAQPQSSGRAEFEVASVRPSGPVNDPFKSANGSGSGSPMLEIEPHRVTIRNMSLFGLVINAYALTTCRTFGFGTCVQLSGGPDWIRKEGFDVIAKMPDDSPEYTRNQLQSAHAPQLQLMLQALLADRFHLKLHRETREMPVYTLTVAKGGPKLQQPADPNAKPMIVFHPSVDSTGRHMIAVECKNGTLDELAILYSKVMERPIVDRTGLTGHFDFTVDYEANTEAPGPFTELNSPSLFRAFQEQAGLKLESAKGPVEILVIDHAEKPTAN